MKARGKAKLLLTALVALAALYFWRSRQSSEEIARLEAIRDGLRVKVAAIVRADPNLKAAPPGNVLIGMPLRVATRLVQQVTEGFFDEVELVLRDIKLHKAGSVEVKAGFMTIRPGDYRLDLTIDEAHALLKPSRPKVDFKGNWFGVSLPVRVARGEGRTTLRFEWDSKRTASLFCDDFVLEKSLTGSVRPRTYDVVGGFELSVREGRLVAAPKFPDPGLVVQVSVEPSEATWAFVDQVVKDRPAACAKALKMMDLRKLLGGLLDKGFPVKVPGKIFRSIDLPAGFERSVVIEGRSYALSLKPTGLKLLPGVLWYGADVAIGEAREPASVPESPVAPVESAPASSPSAPTPSPSSSPPPSPMPFPSEPSPAASPGPSPTPPAEPSPNPEPSFTLNCS